MKKSTKENLEGAFAIFMLILIGLVIGVLIGSRWGTSQYANYIDENYGGIELTRFVDKVNITVDRNKWIETSPIKGDNEIYYSLYSRENWEYFEREQWASHNDGPDYGCKKYKITGFRSKERTSVEYDTHWKALEIDEKALHCPDLYDDWNK